MAKKQSKTVRKSSKSSTGKKKKISKSPAPRKPAAKKPASAPKAAKKKVTKKAPTKTVKKTTKKTTASKAVRKKPTATKAPAKAPAAKSAKPTPITVAPDKASKSDKTKKQAPPAPVVTVFKRTAGPKPSSLSAPRPAPYVNGDDAVDWTPAKLRKVKTDLTRKDLNDFLALLLEKRAEIMGDVAALESARRAQDGDISHVPLHMADVGSDNYEQEFTLGLMESERKLVLDIDAAIERIQDKTYGVCLESGKPIPRARLEIKPWARYTIEVVRERERLGLPV